MTKQELFKIIEEQDQLPTLPSVVTKVLNLLGDSNNVSAKDIGDVISTDLSLSSKTLKIVNSAFYGFPRKVSTITQAIVILGFNTIKSALFGVAVINAFDKYKKSSFIDYNKFWQHSVGVGSAARVISKISRYKFAEEAFIGGVIHDIGKLVLSQFCPDKYKQVLNDVFDKENKLSYCKTEMNYFGFDHAEVGYHLAEKWNLPNNLSSVIRYHHSPLKAPKSEDTTMINIVSVANTLVNILGIGGDEGNYYINEIQEPVWEVLNLKVNDIPEIYDEIKKEYRKASLFLYS